MGVPAFGRGAGHDRHRSGHSAGRRPTPVTKRDSGEHRVRHALLASVLMGSQQRNEDQKILDPLMGAQCLEHRQRMPQAIGADDLTRIV